MRITLLQGDVLANLATVESESVQCVVTSPPYWGLRDYGTATWEGGSQSCDHLNLVSVPRGTMDSYSPDQQSRLGMCKPYREECAKCGAQRVDQQIGLERTPEEYVARMVEVFREVRRVLRKDGTLWLNIGDSYNSIGHKKSGSGYGSTGLAGGKAQEHMPLRRENTAPGLKHKDLVGIPWLLAFALRSDGWYLRQDIIWSKPNPMPESVRDRCTKAHEYLFLLAKSEKYYYDVDAIKEPIAEVTRKDRVDTGRFRPDRGFVGSPSAGCGRLGASEMRNKRSVWFLATQPYKGAHFATFPEKLVEPCILAGSRPGDLVLDPFAGSCTTGVVALRNHRSFLGIELNPKYIKLGIKRVKDAGIKIIEDEVVEPEPVVEQAAAAAAGDSL